MNLSVAQCLADTGLQSKIDLIQELSLILKNGEPEESAREEAKRFVLKLYRKISPTFGNYFQVGPKYALGYAVGFQIFKYLDPSHEREGKFSNLNKLFTDVKALRESKNRMLSSAATEKLLLHLPKCGVPLSVLVSHSSSSLVIPHIPFQNLHANAWFYPALNMISMYRPETTVSDFRYSPESIFFHEIGHLVAYRLTKDKNANRVPDSFLKLTEGFGLGLKDSEEDFADFFAIGIMMETELDYLKPKIPALDAGQYVRISRYMKKFIKEHFSHK